VPFLVASTTEWASANLVTLSSSELVCWQLKWPLPIGKLAVATRLAHYNQELIKLAPFEEQEALWALRINDADSTADLFGLGTPYRNKDQTACYAWGELKYVLRGGGTQLFDLVRRAERWWDRFRGEKTVGRPVGSGTWESTIEFWIALRAAVHALRAANHRVTQDKVADELKCDPRVLRRWLEEHSIKWEEVPKIP
jgi:hypothetical protein